MSQVNSTLSAVKLRQWASAPLQAQRDKKTETGASLRPPTSGAQEAGISQSACCLLPTIQTKLPNPGLYLPEAIADHEFQKLLLELLQRGIQREEHIVQVARQRLLQAGLPEGISWTQDAQMDDPWKHNHRRALLPTGVQAKG